MKRITRSLAVPAALILTASPVVAFGQSVDSGEPMRLTDSELDDVTAGHFVLNFSLQNVHLALELNNVALNSATVIQANVMGNSWQSAQAIALQTTTQVSASPAQISWRVGW
jgi:hypothetical protein